MSEFNTSLSPKQQLCAALAALAAGQVLWFAMLFPLLPKDGVGWMIAAGLGAIATVWVVCSIAVLLWLNRRKRPGLVSNMVGGVVALQFGVGFFALAAFHQDLIVSHFSYFGR